MGVILRVGGGMRVKILNALAEGIPIVSTTLGYEGSDVMSGQDILAGDIPEAFATEVLRVLSDPNQSKQLTTNRRRLVEKRWLEIMLIRTFIGVYRNEK